jgi:hypothetical protein
MANFEIVPSTNELEESLSQKGLRGAYHRLKLRDEYIVDLDPRKITRLKHNVW